MSNSIRAAVTLTSALLLPLAFGFAREFDGEHETTNSDRAVDKFRAAGQHRSSCGTAGIELRNHSVSLSVLVD